MAICQHLVTMMAGEIGVDTNPFAASGRLPTFIIAFTADVTTDSRIRGKVAGMNIFLTKPVSLKSLQTTLNACLSAP